MKVEVNESKDEKEIEFPCLMMGKGSSIIILATGVNVRGGFIGTKITGDGCSEVGEYLETWSGNFKPFKGSITLSND